jgi:lipopolysaccharide export LptBFGC system permease protein LptF
MSQNNELRAMKASGINLLQIILPTLFVGLALTIAMFVFNDQIAGNASFKLRKMTKQMAIKHPKALIEPGRFVDISDTIKFMTRELNEDQLKDIVAYEVEGTDKPVRTIMADRGEIISDPASGEVQIRLYDGSISDNEEEGVHTMQFKTFEFPSLGQEEIQKMQKKKKDYTLAEMLLYLGKPETRGEDRLELWTAFHQQIAFAFASFIFVFIGIPVAMLVSRGETILGFVISMAAVGIYHILFLAAKTVALQGFLPPMIVMWIPNILLFSLGFYLLRRALAF